MNAPRPQSSIHLQAHMKTIVALVDFSNDTFKVFMISLTAVFASVHSRAAAIREIEYSGRERILREAFGPGNPALALSAFFSLPLNLLPLGRIVERINFDAPLDDFQDYM